MHIGSDRRCAGGQEQGKDPPKLHSSPDALFMPYQVQVEEKKVKLDRSDNSKDKPTVNGCDGRAERAPPKEISKTRAVHVEVLVSELEEAF